MKDVQNTELFPRNLPDPEAFQLQARSLGVSNDSHVVVYDNTPFCGYFVGGRAWWMFKLHGHDKVSILDGAMKSWEQNGYPVTTDIEKPNPGDLLVKMDLSLKKSHSDMVDNLKTRDYQVCDTRAYADFAGNPSDPGTGHYPGAVSMTLATTLIDKVHNRLHTVEKLHQIFHERGIDLNKPVVGMCKSGMSSCTAAFVAMLCGATDVAVYLGGYREWTAKAKSGYLEQTSDEINTNVTT